MPGLDTGNTGFILLCSSLVMLMTPGLAFFYGGLVGRRNVLAIMIQSFVSMGWTTVIWFAVGYSLSFSGGAGGVIGNLDKAFLNGISLTSPSALNPSIPEIVFVAYQMMFAIITPALITGAFANRVTFKAYMVFLTAWLLFVYFPFVHMIWGGGLLAQWGVLDFAGGIVVHNTAGVAALASVLYVGRRTVVDRGPHSIPLVALGTGLLWFGWYGFNAGSEFRVDATTAVAFLNTDLAASFAAMAWLFAAWILEKRPSFLGLLTGAVAGLATVTPAAGYVSPAAACLIGAVSGIVCYGAVALKNRRGWDDALDVWGVHGVGGFLGIVMLGLLATKAFNPGGADGLIAGNVTFFAREVAAVLLSSVWAFGFTYGMLWLIDRVTPVHVPADVEESGLDAGLHHEEAYLGGRSRGARLAAGSTARRGVPGAGPGTRPPSFARQAPDEDGSRYRMTRAMITAIPRAGLINAATNATRNPGGPSR
jgi:Amt family ammonium transporter